MPIDFTILVIMFQHFLITQHRQELPQVKRYLISSTANLVHELPHGFPNDLRLRVFRNQEILEKCQIWVETQPSVQSSFQKLNFDSNCQKTRKIREQIFEALSNFTAFAYFMPNILSRIVDLKQFRSQVKGEHSIGRSFQSNYGRKETVDIEILVTSGMLTKK